MSWVTAIWAMLIGACAAIALTNLVLGLSQRRAAHLAFVLAAVAVIGIAFAELIMMRARSAEQFADVQRWTHVPIFFLVVALVAFVRLYFQTGRLWLGIGACAVRFIALIINFAFPPSLNFRAITGVRQISFLGETVSVPIGVISPWTRLGELSSLLLLAFVVDASISLWRTRTTDARRRALIVGGGITFFILVAAGVTTLIHARVIEAPYIVSFPFAAILAAMGCELAVDLFRAGQVAKKLEVSEASLHDIEERVSLAAEAAQLGVWELNPITRELWVSDKVRKLFDFEPGRNVTYAEFQERIHPDDRAAREAVIEKTIAENAIYDFEYRIILPEGTVRWLAGRARCYYDSSGTPCRLLGVTMDVTQRKQAEELFQVATEASPCGILLVDAHRAIVLANAQVEELFGYRREELIGKNIGVLFTERDAEHYSTAWPALESALPPGQNGVGKELVARRKTGTEFPIEIALNPIYTSKGLLVLATIVNLYARKAAETEARQRRQQVDLLSRASLLGEMTASLAHELNQPLSAIVTNATAGTQYIDKGWLDAEQLREIFTDVAADGRRAYDIIDNVRSAIKKGSAIRSRISLNDVVKSVMHMVYPDAAAHFCKLEVSLAENLPTMDGDPTQMQQVLINLIRNAFDAMRDTPPARRVVQITTSYNGNNETCVAVRDYGAGIPETTRERLFEQFFTTKEEGLGMGLSIVRSIVEAHGGRIAAENAAGGGARFCFHVPIQNEVLT